MLAPEPTESGGAPAVALLKTDCPICGTDVHDREVYRANFILEELDAKVFSARRLPDRLHYRMVRCGACGLLRSNPILPIEEMARLYSASHFTYGGQSKFTSKTYANYLRRALPLRPGARSLLEIGCGSGFFLEEASALGIPELAGVEPSTEAISHARADLRPRIQPGLYRADSFAPDSFDLVCAFQVFDHVPEPRSTVRAAFRHLRPGGVALFINHDSGALTNRLLGEHSPIVDVEHTALYDRRTMRLILEKEGFRVREVFSVQNTYPLSYWAHLAPMPTRLKGRVLAWLEGSALGNLPVTLWAGNLGVIASKD